MVVEVVATDLDGTFVASDHTIRDDTVVTYLKLRDRVKFVICTGRSLQNARAALQKKRPDIDIPLFPGVYCHGSIAFGASEDDVVLINGIQISLVRQLVHKLYDVKQSLIDQHEHHREGECQIHVTNTPSLIKDAATYSLTIYKKEGIYVDHTSAEFENFCAAYEEWPIACFNRDFTDEDLEGTFYVSVTSSPCILFQARKIIDKFIQEQSGSMKAILPVPESIHILSTSVNKALAIQKLCEVHGWNADQVLAIGDSDNDVEMLEWAKISVVMGNGSASAKQVAKYLTDHSNDGGWSKALEKLVSLEDTTGSVNSLL